jgi:hypothetical protein
MGSEGVQVAVRGADLALATKMRALVEQDGGYYEADLRLPKTESDVAAFDADARAAREAGATVARSVFLSGRRYEVFKTMEDYRAFHAQAEKTLTLVEPVLRRRKLKLAIENHKDHTTEEFVPMMRAISSEWIGVLVDTGNNIALLEEPHAVVEALAPFALSVHFKDMAVQPYAAGFLLSEVPLGTGLMDLPRVVRTLVKANPGIVLNLEMGTRDPLRVPCRTDAYFATFPERKAARLESTMQWVAAHPPAQAPPAVSGKPTAQILAEEETNNRDSLAWMNKHVRA